MAGFTFIIRKTHLYFVLLQVKYKEAYEKNKGKVIGIKSVSDDSQMAHSALATKLQSDLHYKKDYEDTKTKYRWGRDGNSNPSEMWEGGFLISVEFTDKLKLENNVKSKFCIK